MDYDAYHAILHHLRLVHFGVFPYKIHHLEQFKDLVKILNPLIAVKVRSAAGHAAHALLKDDDIAVYVDIDTRIQVLDTIMHLLRADMEQCAALLQPRLDLTDMSDLEDKFIKLIWRSCSLLSVTNSTITGGGIGSVPSANGPLAQLPKWRLGRRLTMTETGNSEDQDAEDQGVDPWPVRIYGSLRGALSICRTILHGSGFNIRTQEYLLDHSTERCALLGFAPFLFCVTLFFSLQIVMNRPSIGPVAQYHENSKYYSGVKPKPNKEGDNKHPHVTIQRPVYKEYLQQTIAPSVDSLKKAMKTYARQGGTSSIFVNDDEWDARVEFYANHGIGWVARPPHSHESDGFKRAGRRQPEDPDDKLEETALEMAVEETFAKTGNRFKPWASNAKAIRIGEIILIVDSDTVVPEVCDYFRDAARELTEFQEVAIIQHESDVMQVVHHYFENGIAYFTRRINRCISMTCANGDVAPFVGHNAFMRLSALQDAAFVDASVKIKKIWSETNVSEDFDMALRLQLKGFTIRWASYSKGDFKEGVSLTCDDELNRWQKYAYGCNELLFNPLIQWWRKGPINKQLDTFIWLNAPIHYKISMLSYMFSYYGIAAAVTLSLLNYLIVGFQLSIDGCYMHSFEIWLACTVVFAGAGNIGFTLLEYRLGTCSLVEAFVENVTWIPFFFFFFGGLSVHLSQALLAHLFSYNISWSATKKEVELSNFFLECPRILKRFWLSLFVSTLIIALMVILSTSLVPTGWRIDGVQWAVIFPLGVVVGCHILYPIILNPWLMIFSY
ncbi:hypothetical protein BD410DRAFT_815362 [Rickenella mellea]|uniref:Uncharacterized protein n=1 Tax=Rickenella mellea TaxID=50990 RepID=A0A4Y7Q1D6_9AGAM|nr:hypothetical protein BD410DRAFT_815362 [Rickenella mellea]